MPKVTYKKSGVDIDGANEFVELIKPIAKKTSRTGVCEGIGGFGAAFKLIAKDYDSPILVSSTDGVGTKLLCAQLTGDFEMLGVDLVAMNVNDIVTCGAEPLFFLDYFAVGKLDLKFMSEVMIGIGKACEESGCALIGGETAEMPGLYKSGDFDLAGFTVGVVEESKRINGSNVETGDVIVGLASTGLHSNGFSFVRKVFTKDFIKEKASDIMKPTQLYVKPVLKYLKANTVKAMAHITGGGFYDNIPRVLPKNKSAVIHAESWKIPQVFHWIKESGKTTYKEMYRTFNMGIGYVLVVPAADSVKAINFFAKENIDAWKIGEIVSGDGVVKIQ
jgi:phosphoribosylformylglycinamidine cyclo-ligase